MQHACGLHGQHDKEPLDRKVRRVGNAQIELLGTRNHLTQELVNRVGVHSRAIGDACSELCPHAAQEAGGGRRVGLLGGFREYARLDYRVTPEEQAYLLEANPNPQIAKDEDFALSAKHSGIDYPALIEQLMRFRLNYAPSRMIV